MLKVKVNYTNDIEMLENKMAIVAAKIIVDKLSDNEIKKLIDILQSDSYDIRW